MALNFVKFQRGSASAYASLKAQNKLENDALYFIYDKTAPEEGGLLYLGQTLIGGTGVGGASQLGELLDVNLTNLPEGVTALADGMILSYNALAGEWIPVPLSSAIEDADIHIDGSSIIVKSGSKAEGQTKEAALAALDSNPSTGDIIFLDGEPNIYNGAQWQVLTGQSIEDRVAALESGLQAVDGKISAAIANSNHLTYSVQNALPNIEQMTQEEVASLENKVLLVPRTNQETGDIYDEYMYVNDNLEKLGTWGVNLANYVEVGTLSDYVSKTELQAITDNFVTLTQYSAEVGDINKLREATGKANDTIVDAFVESLKWHEITVD